MQSRFPFRNHSNPTIGATATALARLLRRLSLVGALAGALATPALAQSNGCSQLNGTSADWQVQDAHHVLLRADRPKTTARIYTITITCRDTNNQTATKTVTVIVPGKK